MHSSDGTTRELLSSNSSAGWNHGLVRHPYFEYERALKPYYTVYNRRLMACCFAQQSTEEGYWLLRQKAALLNTGKKPIEFVGPDAVHILDTLLTRDISALKINRCAYALACYPDGGLMLDGIVIRLAAERFWFVHADGDFYPWALAHAAALDVRIFDPHVFVTQVQGPNALRVLAEGCDHGLPDDFPFYAAASVRFGGQSLLVSRTGYSSEIGWEFYTEAEHDSDQLWQHLMRAGEDFGLALHGLDALNIRRIEAGLLNAGSDFTAATSPWDVGLARFIDKRKAHAIGCAGLLKQQHESRLVGLKCAGGAPLPGGKIAYRGAQVGAITAGARSPYLRAGVGIGLLTDAQFKSAAGFDLDCADGSVQLAEIVNMPFYDQAAVIPRGRVLTDW